MERENIIIDRNSIIYKYNLRIIRCEGIRWKYFLSFVIGGVFSGIILNVVYYYIMEKNILCLEDI